MTERVVLAGDVGGTNARLALFVMPGTTGGRAPLREAWAATYPSASAPGLEAIVQQALADSGRAPVAASFGIAGPVRDGRCRTTNLPWEVDARVLARVLSLPATGLLNDLEATAWGIADLAPADLRTLLAGEPPPAPSNRALIAAGTGLGEAGLAWDGRAHVIVASEGGHASFAPANAEQDALLRELRGVHGHVSWERVLSGPGLEAIHAHLGGDRDLPASGIAAAAETGDATAVRAMEMFASVYGAEAGNLGLKFLALGGVFLGGGIAPKLLRWLQGPAFSEAFLSKGRMRPLMQAMPVHVILDDRTALHGAARHAIERGA